MQVIPIYLYILIYTSAISAYLNSNIVIVPELSTSIYLNFSIRLLNSYSFNYLTKIVITSFLNLLPPFEEVCFNI